MNRIVLSALSALIATSNITAPHARAEDQKPAIAPKWAGTASCKIITSDGKKETVSCSCSGASSYEDADNDLNAQIEAAISAKGARKNGSVKILIKKQLI